MQKSLLITGGTGFVGRALLRCLINPTGPDHSYALSVLSRNPQAFATRHPELTIGSKISFFSSDILHKNSLPDTNFDYVIHAAGSAIEAERQDLLAWFDEIVIGSHYLLDWALRHKCKKFLFISSGAVYGSQSGDLVAIPEDYYRIPDPLQPCNVYAIAKRTVEHLCCLYARQWGLHTIVARGFSFVGPDLPLDVHFAIGNFIRDALCHDAIEVRGDGSPLRTYLYQDDLAHWLMTLLEHGRAGEAYNLGSDEVVSIADLAHLVRDLLAPGKPVRILGQFGGAEQRNRYVPDIRKAHRELGLQVTIPLAEAIRRTGAYHRARLG